MNVSTRPCGNSVVMGDEHAVDVSGLPPSSNHLTLAMLRCPISLMSGLLAMIQREWAGCKCKAVSEDTFASTAEIWVVNGGGEEAHSSYRRVYRPLGSREIP